MQKLNPLDTQLLALRHTGASLSAIAARLGLSKTGVFRRLKELEAASASNDKHAPGQALASERPTPRTLDRDTIRHARAELRAQQKLKQKLAEKARQDQYRQKLHQVCISLGHALEALELEDSLSEEEYQELRQFLRSATRTMREASLQDKELQLANRLYSLVNPLIKDLTEQHEDKTEEERGQYTVSDSTHQSLKAWIGEAMRLVRG